MKKITYLLFILLFFVPEAESCVGKILTIGVTKSIEGQVLAEMLSTLVNERTGTTINIEYYDNRLDLYEAVKVKKVDISIENTTKAAEMLNLPEQMDVTKTYELVKERYAQDKGLIWLKPFGFTHVNAGSSPSYTATILRNEVLNSYPALPRLFNKLGKTINDETYATLMNSAESGTEPKKVAKDFLKSKKLI